jgi:hypothetical protein
VNAIGGLGCTDHGELAPTGAFVASVEAVVKLWSGSNAGTGNGKVDG